MSTRTAAALGAMSTAALLAAAVAFWRALCQLANAVDYER